VVLRRRLELTVVLPGLLRLPWAGVLPGWLRLPWAWRRVVLGRVLGLLPGWFLRATGTVLLLAGIVRRRPRLVFLVVSLPVVRLRVLVWPTVLAVGHLAPFPVRQIAKAPNAPGSL
jgi:hypothetical protein